MKVYVVLDHIDQECTVLDKVYANEEDAREYIIECASRGGFEVVSGDWRKTCGENEFSANHKNYPYRASCSKVYVEEGVRF